MNKPKHPATGVKPDISSLHYVLNNILSQLMFLKIGAKENYIIYAANISSSLADNMKNYILVFVPTHLAIVDKASIFQLRYSCVQTRSLKINYKIPPQTLSIPRDIPDPLFFLTEREQGFSKYRATDGKYNFDLVLLHDNNKKSIYQYFNKMTLIGCLNTYKCSITFDEIEQPRAQQVPQQNITNVPLENNYRQRYVDAGVASAEVPPNPSFPIQLVNGNNNGAIKANAEGNFMSHGNSGFSMMNDDMNGIKSGSSGKYSTLEGLPNSSGNVNNNVPVTKLF